MNNYEQIIIEYYTTPNNQRRTQLHSQIMGDLQNEQQIENLIQILIQTQNPYVITYICNILSKTSLSSPQLMNSKAIAVQTAALQMYLKIQNNQLKKQLTTLFSAVLIGSWQCVHNTQVVVSTFQQLKQENYDMFLEMTYALIETFRNYQEQRNFPKKVLSEFRNNIVLVICNLLKETMESNDIRIFKILEICTFVCNVNKIDETEDTPTFTPTVEYFHFLIDNFNILVNAIPMSLPLFDQLATIRGSTFHEYETENFTRDQYCIAMLNVIQQCLQSNQMDIMSQGISMLYKLHLIHHLNCYIQQEFIDIVANATIAITQNGNDNAFYSTIAFWGLYDLYSSVDPTSNDCVVANCSKLI